MTETNRPGNLTPLELKAKRDRQEPHLLLDVREPEEYQVANIGGVLIPLGELPLRLGELGDKDQEIVVLCHHGMRSAAAANLLIGAGFSRVLNLTGGIDRWSREVDPSVPWY